MGGLVRRHGLGLDLGVPVHIDVSTMAMSMCEATGKQDSGPTVTSSFCRCNHTSSKGLQKHAWLSPALSVREAFIIYSRPSLISPMRSDLFR